MKAVSSDIFGLRSAYLKDYGLSSTNLAKMVRQYGFRRFCTVGITSYLTFRYPVLDYTMFQDYSRVPFGHTFRASVIRKHWLPNFTESSGMTYSTALKTIDELLRKIIRRHANAHQVAVPLSGGVDSSIITAILRDLFPTKEIRTYTAGFRENNEFRFAREVAEHCNTFHQEALLDHEHFLRPDGLLQQLILHKGEPLHPNEIPLAFIEQQAKRDGCTMAMCGEGADDLFGGYSHLLSMHHNYPQVSDQYLFIEYLLQNYRYFSLEDRERYIKREYYITDDMFIKDPLFVNDLPKAPRDQAFYFIQRLHTPGLITRGANAMRFNGLVPSFPFIDQLLVDFVNSLPFEWKLKLRDEATEELGLSTPYRDFADQYIIPKYILKNLAEKYLPEDIVYRNKVGFPVPFDDWLKPLNSWDFNSEIFINNDLRPLNGWKKFMLINLDSFIKTFRKYQK